LFFWREQQDPVLLAQVNNNPGVTGKSLRLCLIILGDLFDGVAEEVGHV